MRHPKGRFQMNRSQYPATAILLAGGKSSRLGFDKQLLQYDGKYLIDMLLELLASLFEEVILVSNTPELHLERDCRVVGDTIGQSGPLGGLHAGLSAASFPVCYLTACDMPWINGAYIRYLMEYQRSHPEAEAVVTRLEDMLEPMNGLYAKSLAPRIETLLGANLRKMTALLDSANTHYVSEAVARWYSADWQMFDNINTPEEWERFEKLSAGRDSGDQTDPHQTAYP